LELPLFDQVAEALRGLLPPELGDARIHARRWGIKVWFGKATPDRVHYEAQVVGPREEPEAEMLAIEIGFHAEHRTPAENDSVMGPLVKAEKKWRRGLGKTPVAGEFLGGASNWRRISETWVDPDLDDPELGLEVASRMIDYIEAIEPLRE
jgi:hypothetical protein